MNSVRVADKYRSGYNERKIHGCSTVSFVEGEGLPNP
jgi:hypothetical protein